MNKVQTDYETMMNEVKPTIYLTYTVDETTTNPDLEMYVEGSDNRYVVGKYTDLNTYADELDSLLTAKGYSCCEWQSGTGEYGFIYEF